MSFLDRTLDAMSKMKESLGSIMDSYHLMPSLIEDEHKAITDGDIDRVEQLSGSKLELGAKVDAAFAMLKQCCGEIKDIADFTIGADAMPHTSSPTLSTHFTQIEDLIKYFAKEGQQTTRLLQLFDGLKDAFEEFADLKDKTTKSVEVNKIVLSKLLANRQENYRFWQEVAADTMAAYDKGGKQKAGRSNSILNVKA